MDTPGPGEAAPPTTLEETPPPRTDVTPKGPPRPTPRRAEQGEPSPRRSAPSPPAQRSGRRWPWLVVAFLILVGAVYVGFFLRYQPLSATETGTTWVDPAYAKVEGRFTSPRGEEFTQYAVTYADGKRLSFMFTLTNTGGLPVTVQAVRLSGPCPDCVFPLEHVATGLLPRGPNENDPAHARPFQPFSLAGGEARNVLLTTRFVHCRDLAKDSQVTFSWVWVREAAGMISHDAEVPLGFNLAVSRTDSCPS